MSFFCMLYLLIHCIPVIIINFFICDAQVVEFYNHGINYPCEEISLRLKLLYLQWSKEYNNLSATRKLFKELINKGPVCVKLYVFMISFERSSNTPDVTLISDLYNDACTRFGQKDVSKCLCIFIVTESQTKLNKSYLLVELWADSIRFAYRHVRRLKARQIYETSLSVLVPELSAILKNEFDTIEEELTYERT